MTAEAELRERAHVLDDLEQWLEPALRLLGVAWLALIVLDLVRGLGPVLTGVSTAIWIVFIVDFAARLALAPDRRAYLRRNWLAAISIAVPALRFLRALRFVRVARLARAAPISTSARVVRVVGSVNRAMNSVRASLARRRFGTVLLMTGFVVAAGAAGMLALERDAPNGIAFKGYADALWWTAMLLTTVGSEAWPQTAGGKVLSLLISIYGLAVFGYIAAALATHFIGKDASHGAGSVAPAQSDAASSARRFTAQASSDERRSTGRSLP